MTEPQRILVTGGTGFVGRHMLRALRGAFPAARLVAAAQPGTAVPEAADAVTAFDLAEAEAMPAMLRQERPDVVVHLAAQAAVAASFSDPLGTWRANLFGSLGLAQAIMQEVPEALLLFASSAEVYGLSFRSGEALTEQALLAPANPYAASKAAADLAMGEMALRGLRVIRLRPVNHTGPGQSPAFVVASFARQIARIEAGLQEPVLRVGALDRWRDFLDVRDVCAGYVAAIRRAEALEWGVAVNLARGVSQHIGDMLQALLALASLRPDIVIEPARLRATDVDRTSCDAGAAKRLLRWQPCCRWEDTLDSVLQDWRQRVQRDALA